MMVPSDDESRLVETSVAKSFSANESTSETSLNSALSFPGPNDWCPVPRKSKRSEGRSRGRSLGSQSFQEVPSLVAQLSTNSIIFTRRRITPPLALQDSPPTSPRYVIRERDSDQSSDSQVPQEDRDCQGMLCPLCTAPEHARKLTLATCSRNDQQCAKCYESLKPNEGVGWCAESCGFYICFYCVSRNGKESPKRPDSSSRERASVAFGFSRCADGARAAAYFEEFIPISNAEDLTAFQSVITVLNPDFPSQRSRAIFEYLQHDGKVSRSDIKLFLSNVLQKEPKIECSRKELVRCLLDHKRFKELRKTLEKRDQTIEKLQKEISTKNARIESAMRISESLKEQLEKKELELAKKSKAFVKKNKTLRQVKIWLDASKVALQHSDAKLESHQKRIKELEFSLSNSKARETPTILSSSNFGRFTSKELQKQADLLHDLGEKCQDTQRRLREFLFEQDTCKICYENPCLLALIPCGHALCEACAPKVDKCPYCQKEKTGTLRLYK